MTLQAKLPCRLDAQFAKYSGLASQRNQLRTIPRQQQLRHLREGPAALAVTIQHPDEIEAVARPFVRTEMMAVDRLDNGRDILMLPSDQHRHGLRRRDRRLCEG